MWLYKLICVFILAKATENACISTPVVASWSSCTRDCGGGVRTRKCNYIGTESEPCNKVCNNGYPYNDGCRCSAWRPGYCCEGCSNPGIDHCKPEMYACGGSPDGIQCTDCYLPYKPAGFNKGCERKPCNDSNGGCSHLCMTVGGLPNCTCHVGYQLTSDEYSCIDIDECLTRTALCGQQCVNTNGSFKCACDSGHRLNQDGFTCDDIDECGTGVLTCSQICINTNGTYHCECEGFYLDNDSVTCIRIESTSIYPETSQNTKVNTSDVTTTYGSSSSVLTTQKKAFPIIDDEKTEGSKHTNYEKSPAVGVGVGVSVCILFLVGGALVMVVVKRRGILHCNRKAGNNKPSENDNMGNGTSNEDNVAQHNYFILEKCGQSISNNAEYYNESNDANVMDDYNTIHETEEPYAHVNVENCDYDHTTNALTPGSDARKTENIYNKLKIDRPGDNGNEQNHGPSVVRISEDDYDTTSEVATNGKDDVSDYNHIPRTPYEAGVTGDNIKGDKEGEYDAVNSMTFKVAQSDESDYAHVNKDHIDHIK